MGHLEEAAESRLQQEEKRTGNRQQATGNWQVRV